MNDAAARTDERRGLFIVLEGGEGAGKSTQTQILAERLRSCGRDVVTTREPGATATGAAIRALLLDPDADVDPWAEVLLYAADRAQHVAEVVRPSLDAGTDVVCDRHLWSSLAYQGAGRGLGVDAVRAANAAAVGDLVPDVTVLLDIDPVAGLDRSGGDDRIERAGTAFHVAVREAFVALAEAADAPVVDATGAPDDVAAAVWAAVVRGAAVRGVDFGDLR
jgi:dTMP kinase